VPYVTTGVIVLLLGLTFWGARGLRLAEARHIWVGLAKETAHQLGTRADQRWRRYDRQPGAGEGGEK
jgi:hypothetical protein